MSDDTTTTEIASPDANTGLPPGWVAAPQMFGFVPKPERTEYDAEPLSVTEAFPAAQRVVCEGGAKGWEVSIAHEQYLNFEGVNLSNTTFRQVTVVKGNFKGADLRNTLWVNCGVFTSDFTGANLDGARFFECDLHGNVELLERLTAYERGVGMLPVVHDGSRAEGPRHVSFAVCEDALQPVFPLDVRVVRQIVERYQRSHDPQDVAKSLRIALADVEMVYTAIREGKVRQ